MATWLDSRHMQGCVLTLLVLVTSVGCGGRTGLETGDDERDAPPPRGTLCVDDSLPRPEPEEAVGEGLTVHDSRVCEPWAAPWRRAEYEAPPEGPPRELWRHPWVPGTSAEFPRISVDGSLWVNEADWQPGDESRQLRVAAFERDGRLRWRTQTLCDVHSALFTIRPDAVGLMFVRWRSAEDRLVAGGSTFVELNPIDGSFSNAWGVPGGHAWYVGVMGNQLMLERDSAITATCRGERLMWTRTATVDREGGIFAAAATPRGGGRAWIHGDLDPIELDESGAVVRVLRRPSPVRPMDRVLSVVGRGGFGWPGDGVFVNEREGEFGATFRHRAVIYVGETREVLLETPDIELSSNHFFPAPDASIWGRQQSVGVRRYVEGREDWALSLRVQSLHQFSVDGSALISAFDPARSVTYLIRVESDGTVAWRYDLMRPDGTPDSGRSPVHVALAPDGVAYITFAGQLLALQTDFQPVPW